MSGRSRDRWEKSLMEPVKDDKGKIVFKSVGYSKEAVEEMHAILTEAFSD